MLEGLKSIAARAASWTAERLFGTETVYLATGSSQATDEKIIEVFGALSSDQKKQVYGKVYELAKMKDATIGGPNWGEENATRNVERLKKALHRCSLLENDNLHLVKCLPFNIGEGGLGSQYFALTERAQRNPLTGHVGYVNGMGVPSLEHAGRDAASFSDRFVDGNNIHCVYHATHQTQPSGDLGGFLVDAFRMKAVDGGSYTKTSFYIAQRWVDFLNENPNLKFLQVAHSEGAAHVAAALRLIKETKPELLSRIRVLNFCPAHFILPESFPDLQVLNFVKKEDGAVNPWAQSTSQIGVSQHIVVVKHEHDHPHNHLSEDYVSVGKWYVQEFMRSGNLYY